MMTSLFLCVAALSGVLARGVDINSRIVNGEEATYGDHPYICSLQLRQGWSYYHICGCVIYNERSILTAAHCLDGTPASALRIQAGTHVLSRTDDFQQTVNVASYRMHENYNGNAGGFPNDIAMMELASPLTFNTHVNNATIDEDPNSSWVNQKCWLSGWGRKSGGGAAADILKKVSMTKISNTDCSRMWSSVSGANIGNYHICFYDPPRSACSGDSGGPVRCGTTITGVTSWGVSTCSGTIPVSTPASAPTSAGSRPTPSDWLSPFDALFYWPVLNHTRFLIGSTHFIWLVFLKRPV